MLGLEVRNEAIALRLAIGSVNGGPLERGILVESIRDVRPGREHEYLVAPTFLFEFAVNDGPSRLSSRDLVVTGHDVGERGRSVTVQAVAAACDLELQLRIETDGDQAAVLVALEITNSRKDASVIVRMVVPKILGLRGRGGACETVGMVSMEIGSNVRLAETLAENGKVDEKDGSYNLGTVGMPYRREAKRIGLPPSMNTMELACFYDATGGGLFVADIDHDVEAGHAPVQLTVSLLGVEGFWVSELPPLTTVELPRLAIGVHADGDWHEAVDYYLAKHRGSPNWTFPPPPAWFRDEGAIYTHSGGGAGGMYLANTIENLPDGAVATFFEVDGNWAPAGPVPFTQAGLAAAGAPLAVTVREHKHEDLFVVDNTGAIAWTSMRDNGAWSFPAVRITPEGFAPGGASLVTVARRADQVDVFVVRADGAVWTVFGPAIDGLWLTARVSEEKAAPSGAPLAAVTRAGRDVDVFVVGHGGAVLWTFERDNGPWLAHTKPITAEGTCIEGGSLVALVRNSVQTDVFFVDAFGRIATVYKTTPADDGRWETARLSDWLTRAGSGIAATTRNQKDEDVFVVGNWGDIQHTAMRDNGGWSAPEALEVHDVGGGLQRDGFAPRGAPITALAGPSRTDLFFVDGDGALARVVQDQDPGEWRRPDVPPSLNLFTVPGAATAAVSRSLHQTDVFLVTKGRLRSFRELPTFLAEAQSLGTNIVYLWDYWEGTPRVEADAAGAGPRAPLHPPYFNKGDYIPRADLGGEDALKEGISRIHALGGKVVLYVEPFIIFYDSFVARFRPSKNPDDRNQGQYLAGRYPMAPPLNVIADHQEQGKEWNVYCYCHTMVPALPEWRAHVLKVVDRLVHGYGADGIFLDSFGWQMNWPMRVDYSGPGDQRARDYWPLEYAQGVLGLADDVIETIGTDRVVLVETPSGPIARHCHGGVSADFAFHARDGLSNQSRITASAVRYGIPEVRYFSNGGDSMNRLHQIYAAGHGLALCHQHIRDAKGAHVAHLKSLVEIRRIHADALIHGHQTYQPQPEGGREDVAAYCYRDRSEVDIITVVNTSEDADYTGQLQLRAEHAGSTWTDLLSGSHFSANGTALHIAVPRGGRSKLDNLLVLQQTSR